MNSTVVDVDVDNMIENIDRGTHINIIVVTHICSKYLI